jgi:hypothetical protein
MQLGFTFDLVLALGNSHRRDDRPFIEDLLGLGKMRG